jgi:ATP-dependent RNA helicase RhlE
VSTLRSGVDILIATPGRLLDLINQGLVMLGNIKYFVLDEADHMLDMGFINDVKKIISYIPKNRQTMLFSATMPKEIEKLATSILKNPIKIAVTPISSPVEVIEQSVYFVSKKNKKPLLIHLIKDLNVTSALVFSKTKHGANKIRDELNSNGILAEAIHSNKSQTARQTALSKFKSKEIKVLVATDIAARGIDIDELSHVFNFDLPEVPETYVHRIGRTGRAGLGGTAISFCNIEERDLLKNIQRLISRDIAVINEHPYSDLSDDIIHIKIQNTKDFSKPNPKGVSYTKNNKGKSKKDNEKRRKNLKFKKFSNK